ncbi:Nramp family divalent metal transporter [Nocardioides sp. AN3]
MTNLGPAFVAGIAYVDPGNVATNFTAGSKFGYLLVWVVVVANAIAVLVQYLSAKLGIATGRTLPQLCRDVFPRRVSWGLWLQAEAVALATDLAEVLGGAIALNLLFGVPLLAGGVITGAVSFLVLSLQTPETQRRFERAIVYFLGMIVFGFVWAAVAAQPSASGAIGGLTPRFDGSESVLLAAGILGATVMPHAVYLHSALVRDRFGSRLGDPARRRDLLRATRTDVLLAMAVAGAVNLAMVLAGAAALQGLGLDSLHAVYGALGGILGPSTAVLFAVALLASGFASSSVGTYAGSIILEGFLRRHMALPVRRLITLIPALMIIAAGLEPTQMLVISQVVLSFGIPFALWPLVILTSRRRVMGEFVNKRRTTFAAASAATVISALNITLIVLTVQ